MHILVIYFGENSDISVWINKIPDEARIGACKRRCIIFHIMAKIVILIIIL